MTPTALFMLDFRIVHDGRIGRNDAIHLILVDVHAVNEEGLASGDTAFLKPQDGWQAELREGVLPIRRILSDVHMASNTRVPGNAGAFFESAIRQREGGVKSHHGRNLAVTLAHLLDEASIFLDASAARVPVRDLVAQ